MTSITLIKHVKPKDIAAPRLYQQLVGTLNYLSRTNKPDIAFSVARQHSRFDKKKASRCLTYLILIPLSTTQIATEDSCLC